LSIRNHLLTVRRFAISMRAEAPRREVPAADSRGRGLFKRKLLIFIPQTGSRG
jgi:hypothetical protein